MNNSVERQINEIYKRVFKRVFTPKVINELLKGSTVAGQEAVRIIETSKYYDDFAKRFSLELAKRGLAQKRGIWRKYYQAAKAAWHVALPPTYKEYEYKVFSAAVKQNFTLIKTIPREMIKLMEHKYVSSLIEEVAKGARPRGSFEKELRKHGAVNAKVIARTETAKLQTAIDRQRATSLGSVCYFWKASKDNRTRPSHRAMDGVVVFWMPQHKKPLLDGMRGDAGEFPNCRCDNEPILYPIDNDIPNANYKLYDFQHDKIVSIARGELIKLIKAFSQMDAAQFEEYEQDLKEE